MPLAALALVLVAAFIHAGWNFLAKGISRDGGGGTPLVFLYSLATSVIWSPVAIWLLLGSGTVFDMTAWIALTASACLHAGYVLCLQRGYAVGDLSVVYPLARGSGPLVATVGAIAVLGERPAPLALVGALLVVGGVFVIAGGERLFRRGALHAGVGWGLATGLFIAAYTVVDGFAVRTLMLAPVLVDVIGNGLRVLITAPAALARREVVAGQWRRHRLAILGIGAFAPLSYILVLSAMRLAPVSQVAPARELSMMVAAWLGARVLGESDRRRRLLASALIVVGVVSLALG